MEAKDIPIEVAATLATGILLCKFNEMHAAAEYVLGHDIWTHEFGDRGTNDRIKQAVLSQAPELVAVQAKGLSPGDVPAFVKDLQSVYGETIELRRGNRERTEHPIDSAARLMPGKPIIAIRREP